MLNGIMLAGGRSSRYGTCKTMLELGKKSLLRQNFALLKSVCDDAAVSCRKENTIEGYPHIYDSYLCYAPISGIYSALKHFQSPVLVLACDLPFINGQVLAQLIEERNKAVRDNANILMTTFRHQGTDFIEALVAIYELGAIDRLKEGLETEFYALHRLISAENRHHIMTTDKTPFFNINYPEDMKKAEEIWGKVSSAFS